MLPQPRSLRAALVLSVLLDESDGAVDESVVEGLMREPSVVLGDVVLGEVVLGEVVSLGDVVLGDFMLGDVVLGEVVLGDVVLGDVTLGSLLRGVDGCVVVDELPGDVESLGCVDCAYTMPPATA